MVPKNTKKSSKIFEIFSLAKYHLGLVEKPYGNSQNHSIDAGPRFLSQNVEYVAFIDRAPHMSPLAKVGHQKTYEPRIRYTGGVWFSRGF